MKWRGTRGIVSRRIGRLALNVRGGCWLVGDVEVGLGMTR